jgi:uncharacterized RDD family membrane protein YckC
VAGNQRVSGIVTPEAVVLHFETAGVASRALARLVDLFVQLGALSVLFGVVGIAAGLLPVGREEALVVSLLVLTSVVILGYPIVAEALLDGRTVGKALFGLRVITREGAPVQARHTSVRGIIGLVEVFLLPFVAVLTCALSPTNQRVGDFAGGTMVVRHRSARRGGVALIFPPPIGLEGYAASLDVSRVSPTQYRILRSFLTRVGDLRPGPRAALGARLVAGMAELVGKPPPPQLDGELFLVCTAAAYQWRHGTVTPSGGRAPVPAWGPPAFGPGAPGANGPGPPGFGWAVPPWAMPAPPAGASPYPYPAYPAGRR